MHVLTALTEIYYFIAYKFKWITKTPLAATNTTIIAAMRVCGQLCTCLFAYRFNKNIFTIYHRHQYAEYTYIILGFVQMSFSYMFYLTLIFWIITCTTPKNSAHSSSSEKSYLVHLLSIEFVSYRTGFSTYFRCECWLAILMLI